MSKLRLAVEAVVAAESMDELAAKLDALREALREDELAEMQALTESEYSTDALVRLSETHQQLDTALAATEPVALYVRDDEYEYDKWGYLELIGTIDGTYAGRWMIAAFAENAAAVWPDGTAVYVRRGKE